jgi:hypothetical protein
MDGAEPQLGEPVRNEKHIPPQAPFRERLPVQFEASGIDAFGVSPGRGRRSGA